MRFWAVLGLTLVVLGAGCGETLQTALVMQRCEQDGECPFGMVCSPEWGECVECWNDSQCGSGRCEPESAVCVECLDSSDCGEGTCALSLHRCVACMKSSDCQVGVCSKATFECVECEQDVDCVASGPCHFAGCYESKCEEAVWPDLSACSDGDPCTLGERCYAGQCQGADRDPACEPDLDFDGFSVGQGDCADEDPTINPEAEETCDGKDNNCDSVTDGAACQMPADCLRTGCMGQICSEFIIDTECESRPELACLKLTTCGPFGPDGACSFQPTPAYLACFKDLCTGADEICDGFDNDCDGQVDEKGVCSLGTCTDECDCNDTLGTQFTKPCSTGCKDCGSFWLCVGGECMEACGPMPTMECGECGAEECGNGQDDDCDGEVDEGCECAGPGTFVNGELGTPCCDGLVGIAKCDIGEVTGSQPLAGDSYYCTLCGDGACVAPEEACNCPTDCYAVTATCVAEGEMGSSDSLLAGTACCENLVAVPASHAVSEGKNVVCEAAPGNLFACTRCGDGNCGVGENGCRCPADCQLETCAVPEGYLWVELSGLLETLSEWLGVQVATAGLVSVGPKICTELPCPPMLPCCNSCYAPLLLDCGQGALLPLLSGEVALLGCVGTECDEVLDCSPLPANSTAVVYGLLLGPAPMGLAVTGFCLEPSAIVPNNDVWRPNGAWK